MSTSHLSDVTRARGVCHFCHRPVTVADGFLEFYALDDDGELRYPGAGRPVALYSHAACGPDCGYPIALHRCQDVRAKWGWLDHVRGKRWCSTVLSPRSPR